MFEFNDLKLMEIQIEQYMRISGACVQFTGEPGSIIIAGNNAQGKTSFISSIWAALDGHEMARKPLKNGATKGRIKLDLNEIIVERTFTEKSDQLRVWAKDGMLYPEPASVLKILWNKICIDPLEFMRLTPKDQATRLLASMGLESAMAELDSQLAEVNAVKAKADAAKREAEGRLSKLPIPSRDLAPKSIEVLLQAESLAAGKAGAAFAEQERIERDGDTIGTMRARFEDIMREIADLQAKIMQLELERDKLTDTIQVARTTLDAAIAAAPNPQDAQAVWDAARAELAGAESHNAKCRELAEYTATEQAIADARAQSESALEDQRRLKASRKQLISDNPLPMPELSFADGELRYNDMPLEQASGAEQLKAALAISMALNPKLRIITIKDGSLLDAENMAIIGEMAQAKGYQVFIERVGKGELGIIFEDGEVECSAT
ncbi:MAG TPA: hypothetical protein VLH56_19365 [Dissulfurispiraceae bacterium]|nr:hypothetical protein [Dissulfurispiraceae bacterium]